MTKFLVLAELNQEKSLIKPSIQVLKTAKNLSSKTGGDLIAIVISANINTEKTKTELGSCGVNKVIIVSDGSLENYNPDIYTKTLVKIVKSENPDYIFGINSLISQDLFPALSFHTSGGLVMDGTDIKLDGSKLSVRKTMYSNKVIAKLEFEDKKPKLVTFRPNTLMPENVESTVPEVKEEKISLDQVKQKIKAKPTLA